MTKIKAWSSLYEDEERLFSQDAYISGVLRGEYLFKLHGNEKHLVKASFDDAIQRNSYYVRRLLHCLRSLLTASEQIVPPTPEMGGDPFTGSIGYKGSIPYEVDSFISSASTMLEQPFRSRAKKYLMKSQCEEFNSIFPLRDDPGSLFWRLNFLRNRAVHIDDETYTSDFGLFGEFSSKFSTIDYVQGNISTIRTTLIDPASIPVSEVIRTVIADRNKTLMGELFGVGKPSGAPKKYQQMKYFDAGFELVEGIPDLCSDILGLLENYHYFCAQWFLTQLDVSPLENKGLFISREGLSRDWTASEIFPRIKPE